MKAVESALSWAREPVEMFGDDVGGLEAQSAWETKAFGRLKSAGATPTLAYCAGAALFELGRLDAAEKALDEYFSRVPADDDGIPTAKVYAYKAAVTLARFDSRRAPEGTGRREERAQAADQSRRHLGARSGDRKRAHGALKSALEGDDARARILKLAKADAALGPLCKEKTEFKKMIAKSR